MLRTRTIIQLLLWILTLPFYVFALLKWHQFKGHFLFQKRFPHVSQMLFCIAFFGQTLLLIEHFLFDYHVSSEIVEHQIVYDCVLSLTFAMYGLVFYRINLVYLKWKSLHEITKPSVSASPVPSPSDITKANSNSVTVINIAGASNTKASNTKAIIKERSSNVYSSKLSVIILIFIFINALIPLLSHSIAKKHHTIAINSQFAVLWILIAFSIFNIKHKKVKEGIGCIMECYAILISLFVQMMLHIVFSVDQHVLQYTTFFMLHFGALVTLYFPLILLLKSEGTLDINQYNHKTNDKIFQDIDVADDHMHDINNINNIVADLAVIHAVNGQQQLPQDPQDNIDNKIPMENASIFVNKCFFHFLYRNQPNHAIFSDYLRICFASENLLFVERVSIFYQIALKLQKNYQMSLIAIGHSTQATEMSEVMNLSTLPIPESIKTVHSLTLSVSNVSNISHSTLSFRNSEVSMTHSRISAVYIDQNGDVAQPPTDLKAQTAQPTPTMTAVTPIPTTFSWKDMTQSKETVKFPDLKYIYRFEFEYLKDVYDHYQHIIDVNSKPELHDYNYDINVYKKSLYLICKEIYDQFISSDSRTEVNLGYDVAKPLRYLFGAGAETLDKFQNYDDFLRVFDGAVIETYRLIINVYNFRFVKYVKNRFTDAVFEKR